MTIIQKGEPMDLISRQAAIDAIRGEIEINGYSHVVDVLEQMPSAQPEKRTEERIGTHACDCISRQAAIDALRTCYETETISMDNGDEYINYGDAVAEIEQLPSEQPTVKPRAKGKWDFIGDNMFMCTSCGAIYTTQQLKCLKQHVTDSDFPPYCPNCGADMREEGDSDRPD